MSRFAILPIVLVTVAASGCAAEPAARSYEEEIAGARLEKDRFFGESADSPIPPERRDAFLPLPYFAADPEYRVAAVLRPSESPQEAVEMPTSTGRVRTMKRAGTLQFTVKGEALSLTAFTEPGPREGERLFVPFSDLTTGTETYAAGRYLDLNRTPTGLYDIDFNQAYHPYCYFDPRFDCPYPPSENRLPTAVRAGERLPQTGR